MTTRDPITHDHIVGRLKKKPRYRKVAMALLMVLAEEGVVTLHFAIYHDCQKQPVGFRLFSDGFQPTPWRCPKCRQMVKNTKEMEYELAVSPAT